MLEDHNKSSPVSKALLSPNVGDNNQRSVLSCILSTVYDSMHRVYSGSRWQRRRLLPLS